MAGLDKILDVIKSEATANSDSLLAQAKKEIEALNENAKQALSQKESELKQSLEAEVNSVLSRGESEAKLQKKKLHLEAKQEIISDIISKAKAQLCSLSDSEYFDVILKLIKKNIQNQPGQIAFSQKDLDRLPADFAEKLKEFSLTISDKAQENLDNGFILQYGGIEANCSFDALFAEAKESLQDQVRDLLFK